MRYFLLLVLTTFCFAAPAGAQSFQGLGALPDGIVVSSTANAVSGDGSTVVGVSYGANGPEAFRWTEATGMVGLGDLPGGESTSDPNGSESYAVSFDGSVVVGRGQRGSLREAFRWTEATGMVGLGDLGEEGVDVFRSEAFGVSADGAVVVGVGRVERDEPFLWTTDGGMQSLGTLSNSIRAQARAVSADGTIVVGVDNAPGTGPFIFPQAFRWTQETGSVVLSDPSDGDYATRAYAVSADGSVVVGTRQTDTGNEAFRWTQGTGMVGLPGGTNRVATAVSADGTVIVGWGGSAEPFIWTADEGLRALQGVLEDDYELDLNGWVLEQVTGISADGSIIVGRGFNPQRQIEAWRAVLAPSSGPTVRNSTRFGNPASPLEGVTVTLADASGDRGSVVTTAGGQANLTSLSLDLSQPYDIRLEYDDLVRVYADLVPEALTDTTLVLPAELANALDAQLAALDSTNTLVLGYDTDAARDLAADVFGTAQPETYAGLRDRDRALARLYTAAHNLREVYAATEPLAAETANVTVDAVLAFVAARKAFQSVQETLDADFDENAWALQFLIESVNVLFASTADAWKQAVSLALPDTAAGWFLQGEQLAWSIATAQTENLDWRDANRVNAVFTQLGTTVVKEVGRVVIASGHVVATDGDLARAVERATDLEGTGTVRDGWEAAGTATIATTDRIETTKNASDAFRSTFTGWNNVAGLARVIGTVPGAQIFLAIGNALLVLDTAGLAVVTIVDFAEHFAVAQDDIPRITDLAYFPVATQGVSPMVDPSLAASRRAAHAQQRGAATDDYLAQLTAIVDALSAGDRALALTEMEALLEDEEALASALQASTLAVQAVAESALARDAAAESGLSGSPFLAAYGETIGASTALAAERAMLYASIAAYAVPELALPPEGSSTPSLAAADSVLAIAGRMDASLGAMNAALDASTDAADGLVAPATVLVAEHGLVGTAGALDLGALGRVAPGETLPLVAEIVNAGDEAAETVTARLILDGDTLGAASALQLVGDAEYALGTLAPGDARTLTWTVATQDTSSTGQGAVSRYEVALSSTTGRVQGATGVVTVTSAASVGSEEPLSRGGPEALVLRVFPNPTHGASSMQVDLPSSARVRLSVYDALGREVAVALDDERPAGTHTVALATDRLAPGVYIIRLVADGELATQQLTVVR